MYNPKRLVIDFHKSDDYSETCHLSYDFQSIMQIY